MADDANHRRDEVLKRLLKTPPKPHVPTKDELAEVAKKIGQTDPNSDFGSEDWEKRRRE